MHIRPILSTLRRHKTAAALIVLEIALTCAIVSNAVFVIGNRLATMAAPSGVAETELVHLRVGNAARVDNADALTRQDLATLRALPGVLGASVLNQVPFGQGSSSTRIDLQPEQQFGTVESASLYAADEAAVQTLGLRLIEGRAFRADEMREQSAAQVDDSTTVPSVILNRRLAERLFGAESALGRQIYFIGNRPTQVVGVVEELTPPQVDSPEDRGMALMVPLTPSYNGGRYVLRTEPAQREAVLKAAAEALAAADTRRVVTQQQTLEAMRHDYFAQHRWMAGLLVGVCVALLVVTAFGIIGLASFWVQQRTRMIGVRRALGASRRQILGYFQLENFLLTGFGIALGMAGAYAVNDLLMTQYAMPRLPWFYLPLGALLLWLLGQLAVLGPARRAAALPPVVVMRGA